MRRVLLLLFLTLDVLFAYNNLTISKQKSNLFDFEIGIYEDVNNSLSFDEIRSIDKFVPQSNKISRGYSVSTFWLKFDISNNKKKDIDTVIYFTENLAHEVDCYIISSDGRVEKKSQGVGYYIDGEINRLQNPQFNLILKEGETKQIYIRLFSHYPTFSAFYIMEKDGLNSYMLDYNMAYSLYFGAMIALLLYNFFIYIFSRDISYLLYIMLVSSLVLWQLAFNSFPPMDSFSSTNGYYRAGSPISFMIVFLIFFSRSILDTKRLLPRVDKFIVYMGYTALVFAISALIFLYEAYIFINILATFAFPFLLYIGFVSYKMGNKVALFYIVAQSVFLPMSTLFSLMSDGMIGYSFVTRHGMAIGSFIEMILFSLALAYRIRLLKDEKIEIINLSNIELEAKVQERTKELELSKIKLIELANRDPMTNLYNRRYLFEISKVEIEKSKETKEPLSLIMLDIDKFKNINDTYGHAVGDKVIKIFADSMKSQIREDDISFRIGGEEFVILLPNTDTTEAYQLATKIREYIELKEVSVSEDKSFNFTTSGGVDCFGVDDDTIHQSLHRADLALYDAKENGRNKIVIF